MTTWFNLAEGISTEETLATLAEIARAKFAPVTPARHEISIAGTETIVESEPDEYLEIVWTSVQARRGLVGAVLVTLTLGAKSYQHELIGSQPFAHGAVWIGDPGEDLTVTTNVNGAVLVNVDYRRINV